MKVFFHDDFYQDYSGDPASEPGRMEAIVKSIRNMVEFIPIIPATHPEISLAHTESHIEHVRQEGLYDISALAAGGAIMAATEGLNVPAFALIRPPGHHASANSSWGFCYFNNMAIALYVLKQKGLIETAFVLDFDLHHGDGNINILGREPWVSIHNPEEHDREKYIRNTGQLLSGIKTDIIGISAGFDHHIKDWGGLLSTDDYYTMGTMVKKASERNAGGCFAILEGGYNHEVLGQNVKALLEGLGG
ncbi:MAG: histone deacetylase family protein [Proteobacteria bacterium]|nr:histone deacetylase family protein [Pseudomonadota bacterium]